LRGSDMPERLRMSMWCRLRCRPRESASVARSASLRGLVSERHVLAGCRTIETLSCRPHSTTANARRASSYAPSSRGCSRTATLRKPCQPPQTSLAEALELTLLLADREPDRYERAATRLHLRFGQEVPHVDLRESLAVLALLVAIPANRLAAAALAELLSRRRSCERVTEALAR
jgi:hypothetical protein